ncbi:hypothetical protein DPEC_G00376260 [Dallia pectoralis]|nr:hypothetical protein DPEC_G00376260 [Dallia pectoralis]
MADDRAVNTTEGQNNEGGIAVKEKAETASNKRADMEKRRSDMEQAERAGRSEGDSYTAEETGLQQGAHSEAMKKVGQAQRTVKKRVKWRSGQTEREQGKAMQWQGAEVVVARW